MPSLRKRVTSYFRQLSFHNEPRERRLNINENSFVTKYLQGQIKLRDGPPVISGRNPADLPNYDLDLYTMGPDTIVGCYTGPNGGLTTVKRKEKHLSVTDPDIDFIDTQQEENTSVGAVKKSPKHNGGDGLPIDNTSMVIKVAGQEYYVTNQKKQRNKSQSLGSLSNFNIEIETTKIDHTSRSPNNNVKSLNDVKSSISSDDFNVSVNVNGTNSAENIDMTSYVTDQDNLGQAICSDVSYNNKINQQCSEVKQKSDDVVDPKKQKRRHDVIEATGDGKRAAGNKFDRKSDLNKENRADRQSNDVKSKQKVVTLAEKGISNRSSENYGISKSKSEGNPFQHKKRGKIIRVQRPVSTASGSVENTESSFPSAPVDLLLPEEWASKTDYLYGLSDSLYDRNQVTKSKNGDPIADCFGIVGRKDSAILAVADGVNWGEKACIAAKSAIHGCLHYLNRTVFNDTKPFENLVKTESKESIKCETPLHNTQIMNTQEVFICLLRAFNCAHDLILENNGMLTTLTVAVILPLKQSNVRAEKHETQQQYSNRGRLEAAAEPNSYVCCVCNVGDTLAYVYSQKYGMRELTKGSHDIHCNRDMRDALGALGPVDGINPELSNLTLSVTTIQRGDIIFVASDGLTDNFDPNVCKFTVSTNLSEPVKMKKQQPSREGRGSQSQKAQRSVAERQQRKIDSPKKSDERNKPPVKPPRRHYAKTKDNINRSSTEKSGRSASEESTYEITKTIEEMTKIVNRKIPEQNENTAVSSENIFSIGKTEETKAVNHKGINSTVHLVSNLTTNFTQSECLNEKKTNSVSSEKDDCFSNPLVAQFVRENSVDNSDALLKCKQSLTNETRHPNDNQDKPVRVLYSQRPSSSLVNSSHSQQLSINKTLSVSRGTVPETSIIEAPKYRFLRSKTSVDLRTKIINRNEDGIPYVTPIQRYELMLLLMEDILRNGISGRESECVTAKELCENLLNFTFSITAAKRHTLEDNDLYFDTQNGLLVEVTTQEKKIRRKRGLERVQNLPGKLDHVTIVAFNVGNFAL